MNAKKNEGEVRLPCSQPEDFYSDRARATIARLIGDWLARQHLTATEFLHSATALEKFESAGTTLQHAVQKIAVADASGTRVPVAKLIKHYNDICEAAIRRVSEDARKGIFPLLEAEAFGAFVAKLGPGSDNRYRLNGALTYYVSGAKDWEEKLRRLLALMDALPAEDPARTLLSNAVDTLAAEILDNAAALAGLLGPNPDLGHALVDLSQLYLGQPVETEDGTGETVNALAAFFAKNELPRSRTVVAARILAEFRGRDRLSSGTLDDELKMVRKLAAILARGAGKYLSREALADAITERSKRLVTDGALIHFLEAAATGEAKIDKLLSMERDIAGAANKRALAKFMLPILTSHSFADELGRGAPPVQRLRRAAEFQERVLQSGFQDNQKEKIAAAIDAVALDIEQRAGYLDSIEKRITEPAERAQAILSLYASNAFTQGELGDKARRYLLAALGKPGFLNAYMAQAERERDVPPDREQALSELIGQLKRAGIAPEDCARLIAA